MAIQILSGLYTFRNPRPAFLLIVLLCATLYSSAQQPLNANDFVVPDSLVSETFKLKPLSRKYGRLDYVAITSSQQQLQGIFGPQSDWPNPKMTLEESLASIDEDYKLFQQRRGFNYSVLNLQESEVLGCVYIFPTKRKKYDAEVVLWVSKKAFDNRFDPVLLTAIKKWLDDVWPFKKIAYPGRSIKWEEWLQD